MIADTFASNTLTPKNTNIKWLNLSLDNAPTHDIYNIVCCVVGFCVLFEIESAEKKND